MSIFLTVMFYSGATVLAILLLLGSSRIMVGDQYRPPLRTLMVALAASTLVVAALFALLVTLRTLWAWSGFYVMGGG